MFSGDFRAGMEESHVKQLRLSCKDKGIMVDSKWQNFGKLLQTLPQYPPKKSTCMLQIVLSPSCATHYHSINTSRQRNMHIPLCKTNGYLQGPRPKHWENRQTQECI